MIEIDKDTKKIFFYYSPDEIKKNSRLNEEMHEFELLSGHVCQDCKCVLDAYYIGTLPIETRSDSYSCHPYMPRKSSGYSVLEPHYSYGHKYGGGYLKLRNHKETVCTTSIANVAGITDGIKDFISWIIPTPERIPTEYELKKFAAEIFENKVPGVFLIEDVCKQREPMLAIDRKKFATGIQWEGHTDFDKEYRWEVAFYKLVIEDKEVQIIGGN
jgi:hypothetical protein